ncbi:MAG TPA: DUF1257 domain-containing protein [Anaerolineaceae bacterium]|nr:DUF1257 domain-containing protein [Anaerolineaceae bacterium]HPN50893.1 DUF1257 domain-containing protein [Anaerolineaceae bacterium]
MSHITSIRTSMVEKEALLQALKDLGYKPQESEQIEGYGGRKVKVEIKVPIVLSADIGFYRLGESYAAVADWAMVRLNRDEFLSKLNQRYAYHAAKNRLESQGFTLVEEEDIKNKGQIRLVLRRTV